MEAKGQSRSVPIAAWVLLAATILIAGVVFFLMLGQAGELRAELEALVAEFENDDVEYYRNIAKLASERLAKLR